VPFTQLLLPSPLVAGLLLSSSLLAPEFVPFLVVSVELIPLLVDVPELVDDPMVLDEPVPVPLVAPVLLSGMGWAESWFFCIGGVVLVTWACATAPNARVAATAAAVVMDLKEIDFDMVVS
jgi:hypothetical protein